MGGGSRPDGTSSLPPARDRLEVGRVVKPHGLRGEVVVFAITNRAERFVAGSALDVDGVEHTIEASRPHQDRWLVRFEGITDRDGAEAIRGAALTAAPLDDASEGEVWAHDVIGAEVVEVDGTVIGRVTAVEANPAHDLLVIDARTLVPMVFVVEQQPGRVVVDLPEGLLDLFA
jgi:16S rRNA processing protein RimM